MRSVFCPIEKFESLPPELTASTDKLQLIEIFLRNCRDESVTVAGSENSIAFEGRLEMPFLRAKQIIFCGMNNEYFPDRIDQTAFLTDSLRRKIGMRSNRETLTRSLGHLLNVTCCRPASIGPPETKIVGFKQICSASVGNYFRRNRFASGRAASAL